MAKILSPQDIAVAYGDGIGPEIMQATLNILEAAGAKITIHPIEVGEKVYLRGNNEGIEPKTWEIINGTKAFLKAPITTPQGGGFRSLNVTVRSALGLFANVRPCVSYYPFIATKHPVMDLVIVRENEEDLYTGIEYRLTEESYHAIKVITRSGSERIIRYAFEYAKKHGRKKVTCFTKDNILKMTDGLFHKLFEEIGKEYQGLEKEHWIIDIGAAKLADTPEIFDVIVMPNLYGDILSDVAAQIAGSVGLAGSANIGKNAAMFEAIHGSAPRRAGQNIANPSGLLLASVMMLEHLGQDHTACAIANAWLKTLEEGIHTYDIFTDGKSLAKVSTSEFAKAVIDRLGKLPEKLPAKNPPQEEESSHIIKQHELTSWKKAEKKLIGQDISIESNQTASEIQKTVEKAIQGLPLKLTLIANRGATLYPATLKPSTLSDEWRIRIESSGGIVDLGKLLELQKRFIEEGLSYVKVENLYHFDGKPGFSLAL